MMFAEPYLGRYVRLSIALSAVLLASVSFGCTKGRSPGGGEQPHMSQAELLYGMSPDRNDGIIYQDDVVRIDNGAEAVHSVSSNGLTWTIDANAPHAQELTTGKIVYLTSRGVGRVLGSQRAGNELSLIIGPVALTDVIKEAHIDTDQPIDMDSMIAYSAPESPGAVVEPERTAWLQQRSPSAPVSLAAAERTWYSVLGINAAEAAPAGAPPPAQGPPAPVNISDFLLTPFCCGGIGIKIVHTGDVNILAYAVIRLSAPHLHLTLDISHGVIKTCKLTLTGVAGLTMKFEAGSATGVTGNIRKQVTVPIDLSLPLSGIKGPFAVTLHQAFILRTGFTAKNSTLSATGDYGFTGSFWMGYENGQWRVGSPTSLKVNESIQESTQSASLGVEGLVMGYQGKVIVGVGAFDFVTGPYIGINTSVGISASSPMGAPCHAADLHVGLAVGVGYSIPHPVTAAINAVLRALNAGQIESFGGIEYPFQEIINKHGSIPAGCAGK